MQEALDRGSEHTVALSLGMKGMVCAFYFESHGAHVQKTFQENVFKGTSLARSPCPLTFLKFILRVQMTLPS